MSLGDQCKRQETLYVLLLTKDLVSHCILVVVATPSKGLLKHDQHDTMVWPTWHDINIDTLLQLPLRGSAQRQ
jgi:hypothetical protein